MRILCDNCSAKYSIADEKVVGKVFKIRCKKCSHVILVRGDGSSPGEAAASQAPSQGGVWYVVRAGQQDGPYSESDIQGLLASGEVESDTYTWREGFADWIPLSSVEELRHLLSGGAVEPAAPAVVAAPVAAHSNGVAEHDSRDEFGGDEATRVVSAGYDPAPAAYDPPPAAYDPAPAMAAAGSPGEATEAMDVASFQARNPEPVAAAPMFGAPDATEAMSVPSVAAAVAPAVEASLASPSEPGGIFGSFEPPSQGPGIGFDPSASFDGGLEAIVPQAPKPQKPSNGLVGARNENSVLFSLNNLTDTSGADAPTDAPANSEASGLIDIRALSASAAAVSGGREGGRPDGGPDPFSVPAAGPAIQVPAMMPMGTRKSNTPLFLAMGAGVLLLLLVGSALIAVLVWRTGEPDPIIKERPDAIAAAGTPGAGTPAVPGGGEGDQPKPEGDTPAAGGDAEKKDGEADGAPGDGAVADGAPKDGEAPDGEVKDGEADGAAAKEAIAAKDGSDDKAAPTEPEKPKTAEEKRKEKERREELAEKRRKERELEALTKKDTPKEEPKKDPKKDAKKDGDSIDDIIGGIGNKPKDKKDPPKEVAKKDPPKEAPAAKAGLSKSDVLKVIRRSNGRVLACTKNQGANPVTGTVTIRFTITPSGNVASAQVTTGKFKGSAVGGCITRVVRGMKFPDSGSSLTINYPFSIK